MFDTPSWMGSFITSRANREINDLKMKHEVMMEDIKHKHEYLIQQSRNKVTEDVAEKDRASREEIARLTREHELELQKVRNQNAISVALINAASKTTNSVLPYVIPAFAAGKLANSKGKNNNGNNNTNAPKPQATVVHVTATEAKADANKKKADDLFPELEPTFGTKLSTGVSLSTIPKINVTQLVPAIGAVLSVAAPFLAII